MISVLLAALLLCDPCNQPEHSFAPVMTYHVPGKGEVSHIRMYCRTIGTAGWVPIGEVYPTQTTFQNGQWSLWPGRDAKQSIIINGSQYFTPGTAVECSVASVGHNGMESDLATVADYCTPGQPELPGRMLYGIDGSPLAALCNWVCWPWTWEVGEEEYVCPCP